MGFLDTGSIKIIERGLDFAWQKQRVISENITNGSTPGYKAKYVTFEEELKKNLDKLTNNGRVTSGAVNKALSDSKIRVHESKAETMRLDGNNVNIEVENIELARVQLQYQYLAKQISDQFTRLRMVIEGR